MDIMKSYTLERRLFNTRITPNERGDTSLLVLGAGGIGSNLMEILTRATAISCSKPQRWRLYDHDVVEMANMNRSVAFHPGNIGEYKVKAISDHLNHLLEVNLLARRLHVDVERSLNMEIIPATVKKDSSLPEGMVIDCRDTLEEEDIPPRTYMKLAYDGGSLIAFYFHPRKMLSTIRTTPPDEREDAAQGAYAVHPSFYVPAALVALIGLWLIQHTTLQKVPARNAGVHVMNIDDLTREVAHRKEAREDA